MLAPASISWPAGRPTDNVTVPSVGGIVAAAIRAVFSETSVSEIFAGEHLAY